MIAESFVTVLLAITLFAVWVAAIGGLIMFGIDADRAWPYMVAAAVVAVLGISVLIWAVDNSAESDRRDCEVHGGSWEQTGTTPILVGKVIVNTPIYGCVLQ